MTVPVVAGAVRHRVMFHLRHNPARVAAALPAVALLLLLPAMAAQGAIVALTGDMVSGPAPASVADGSHENNFTMLVFAERTGQHLAGAVDALLAAPALNVSGDAVPAAGSLAAGTAVDSWLVHADRLGSRWQSRMSGSISFDSNILAVIVRASNLNASDAALGAPGTVYGQEAFRGIDDANDTIAIAADLRSLTIQLRHGHVDQLRILTAAALRDASPVPLPPAWLLLPSALLALARTGPCRDAVARTGAAAT